MFISRRVAANSIISSAKSFLGRTAGKIVPNASESTTGLFGNDSLKSAAGFSELTEQVKSRTSALMTRIEEGDSSRTTVELVDDLSNELCVAADLAECVRNMHSDQGIAKAAETSTRELCMLVETLNTHRPLYEKLKQSKENEKARLDDVDRRTLDLLVEDFEQSGVHLENEQRNEFLRVSGEIFDAGSAFTAGCDQPVEIGRADKAKYQLDSFTLHSPLAHSISRSKRKFVYNSYMRPIQGQEESLRRLVGARHSLARLSGFDSFAHRAQRNSLLGSYEQAHDFLWGLIQRVRPSAERELAVLLDVLKQCDHDATSVGEWDLFYLTHLYKERAFGFVVQENLTKFVTLGNVLAGFDRIIQSLYGVTLEQRLPVAGEMWPGAVVKLVAVDSNGNEMGTVYMDIEHRATKTIGDCHYTVRCTKELEGGGWQSPVAVLSLSLSDCLPPSSPLSSLSSLPISVQSAENLFHELGHAMHSILGRTKYQHVSGTRCPTDLAEVPSMLMEYYFNDLTVMRSTLRTPGGESIDVRDAATLISSRFACSALDIIQQASYGLFDLELHSPEYAEAFANGSISSNHVFSRIFDRALPHLERDPTSAYQHRFHHLVAYGAKYYSYLVARASASLIWHTQFQSNPFNAEAGGRWASAQSHGGGLPSPQVLSLMLGSPPAPSGLIDALVRETTLTSNLSAVNV